MKYFNTIILSLLLSCLLLSGCGDPNQAKLVGIWEIEQADKVMRRLQQSADSDDEEQSEPKMQLEFRRNGNFVSSTLMGRITPNLKQGSWKMLSYNESTRTMSIHCTVGSQETEHEIQFTDDNTIKLIPPNMAGVNMKLVFIRKQ